MLSVTLRASAKPLGQNGKSEDATNAFMYLTSLAS
jgi:hypothetical protein